MSVKSDTFLYIEIKMSNNIFMRKIIDYQYIKNIDEKESVIPNMIRSEVKNEK